MPQYKTAHEKHQASTKGSKLNFQHVCEVQQPAFNKSTKYEANNNSGTGLCGLNRCRWQVSDNMGRCERVPSTEWSRFEGMMSFSLAAGMAISFQNRGRSSLVSLTSKVTFGHRSVATNWGPICQCHQNTYTNTHTHFHLLSAVTTVSHLSNGLHKKRQICPQVHCPAAFCPLAKAVPPCEGTFLHDYSLLQPGQDHYSLPALLPIRHCSAICETAFHWERLMRLVQTLTVRTVLYI